MFYKKVLMLPDYRADVEGTFYGYVFPCLFLDVPPLSDTMRETPVQ